MKVEELAEDFRRQFDRMETNIDNLAQRIKYLEKLFEKYHVLELKTKREGGRTQTPNQEDETMKVIKYTTSVSGGVLEWTHGMEQVITEYWIPKHNLCVNLCGGNPNVFESDAPRNPIEQEEVEVEQHLIDHVLRYWEARKAIHKEIEELYLKPALTTKKVRT